MKPFEQENRSCQLLEAFVPDLVTRKERETFLRRLLNQEKGVWVSVRALCEGINEFKGFFETLESITDCELVVVWLDHPSGDRNYSFIQFYFDDYFWKSSAIVNRKIGTT